MASDSEDFAALAHSWAKYFRNVGKIVVALRGKKGWRIRCAITAFSSESALQFLPLDVTTKSIRAIRMVSALDSSSAPAAVEKAIAKPGSVLIGAWEASITDQVADERYYFERMHPQRLIGAHRLPTFSTRVDTFSSDEGFPSLQLLDLELLAHHTPFESFGELLLELRALGDANEIISRPRTEIILTPPVLIEPTSELRNNKIQVNVACHPQVAHDDIQVALKAFSKDGASTRRFLLEKDGHEAVDANKTVRVRFVTEIADTPLALSLLTYKGEFAGRWWVRDETLSFNERWQAHRTIDKTNAFRETFFDVRDEFEDRIALLLELLGLRTLKYGGMSALTNAPDILAVSPAFHVYVVECTTGDVNSRGKLQKLNERGKEIKLELDRLRYPVTAIQSVIFTSLPRSETAAHWGTAQNLKISLVCREQISNLLNQLESPQRPPRYSTLLSLLFQTPNQLRRRYAGGAMSEDLDMAAAAAHGLASGN